MLNVYEQPIALLIAGAVLLLVVWIIQACLPDGRRWWLWLLPILVALTGLALDYCVQTDNENIRNIVRKISKAAEREDPNSIAPLISDNYRDSSHNTKNRLMKYCRWRLKPPLIKKNITRVSSLEFTSQTTATAVFTTRIIFDEQSIIYQSYKATALLKIQLQLHKTADKKWLIDQIELLEIDRIPANWKDISHASNFLP